MTWTSGDRDNTQTVAWGDIDRDGESEKVDILAHLGWDQIHIIIALRKS